MFGGRCRLITYIKKKKMPYVRKINLLNHLEILTLTLEVISKKHGETQCRLS